MSGMSSFFRSQRFSDVQLALIVSRPQSSVTELCSHPILQATQFPELGAGSDSESERTVLTYPAHKVILMGESAYFSTRLSSDVGAHPTSTINEHAASVLEAYAMDAVVEFLYTHKLAPEHNTEAPGSEEEKSFRDIPYLQRLLHILQAAERWQVAPCLSACCSAICAHITPAGMSWEACFALYSLPVGIREQPYLSQVMFLALEQTLACVNFGLIVSLQQTQPDFVSVQLHKLPVDVRLALLKSCRLNYVGMMALLSSDEQVADSEDSLALLLCQYLADVRAPKYAPVHVKALLDQLRYQHMSIEFVCFQVPITPSLCLDSTQAAHLMYIRSLNGSQSVPAEHRLSTIPSAWYAAARTQAAPDSQSIKLNLKISEDALSVHLKASGSFLQSEAVTFKGISWCLVVNCRAQDEQRFISVRPTFHRRYTYSPQAGVHATISSCVDSAAVRLVGARQTCWSGEAGQGFKNLLQNLPECPGSPADLAWWRSHMTSGHLSLSATVTLL